MRMIGRAMIAAALASAACLPAKAAPDEAARSVYTSFDTKKCKHKPGNAKEEDYGLWTCPGYGRDRVFVSAGDQRMNISFGPKLRDDDVAAGETLNGFNDAYEGTIEWRLAPGPDGKPKAFATILRWNVVTAADMESARGPIKPSGRTLVVTAIGEKGSCHVGYVDARANPDANELARKLADERARTFRCGEDEPKWVGRQAP